MKKLIVLISLLLMATAAMGQSDKPQPKMNLRMGSVQQTVFPGDTIEHIVYVVEGAHVVEFSLLDSLTGKLWYDDFLEDSLVTISGAVARNTDPGEYLIQIIAKDTVNETSVISKFYITVLSLNDAFVHSSGSLKQSVMAGDSIEPIVFDYQKLHDFRVDNLPSDLVAQNDTISKTITIEGAAENVQRDKKYTFALVAYLTEQDSVVYNLELEVEHIPVVTAIRVLENDSQVVVAGDSIKPITLKYENITDLHFKDIPKTLDPYNDPEAKMILLQGAIPEDFGDSTLVMSICAKGLDNNDTAFVKLVIKHKPGKTTIAHASGKTTQTVNAGDSIEPIVFKYELAMNALGLNFPKGTLVAERDTKAKTITVKGAVSEKASGEYNMKVIAEGYENNDTAEVKIIVKNPEAASSSSVAKSSSSKSKSSSSAKSGSAKSSSSSGKSSSSSKKGKDALPTVAVAPQFNVEVVGRNIQVLGAVDAALGDTYALLDMQGRVLRSGPALGANFAIPVDHAGAYLVRIGKGVQRVSVK
ncbi:hypothetical protein [uncultured Fibrobacter sp.]|uniref:hypothetical protein n=1 Tax=uncultured Fibrobacter sp. TaxID=261512 RepID=UPI0025F36A37|nr:hypothetical protein [uncultured Fibrobacter sp.]